MILPITQDSIDLATIFTQLFATHFNTPAEFYIVYQVCSRNLISICNNNN